MAAYHSCLAVMRDSFPPSVCDMLSGIKSDFVTTVLNEPTALTLALVVVFITPLSLLKKIDHLQACPLCHACTCKLPCCVTAAPCKASRHAMVAPPAPQAPSCLSLLLYGVFVVCMIYRCAALCAYHPCGSAGVGPPLFLSACPVWMTGPSLQICCRIRDPGLAGAVPAPTKCFTGPNGPLPL